MIHSTQPVTVGTGGGKYAYILNVGLKNLTGDRVCQSSLTTVDASTGAVIRTWGLPEVPAAVAVDAPDGRVFVVAYHDVRHASFSTGYLQVFDLQGRGIRGSRAIAVPARPQVAVDTVAHRLYVQSAGHVTVVNTQTVQVLATLSVPGAGGAADHSRPPVIEKGQDRVFVLGERGVAVINGRTARIANTLDLGRPTVEMVILGRAHRLFVTTTPGCQGATSQGGLEVINTVTLKIVGEPLKGCEPIAPIVVDERANRLLAGVRTGPGVPQMAVLDAYTGFFQRFVTGRPRLLYWASDARTGDIYFADQVCSGRPARCTDHIDRLDPHTWSVTERVPVAHAWQGVLHISETNRTLFVASPYYNIVTMLTTR